MKRKPTKIERFIRALPGDHCDHGLARAARRYRGLTLQQAWRKADSRDLREVCSSLGIKVPRGLRCAGCTNDPTCWAEAAYKPAAEFRKALRGIPTAVQRAYAKA